MSHAGVLKVAKQRLLGVNKCFNFHSSLTLFSFLLETRPPYKLIITLPRQNCCVVMDKLRTIIPILKEVENNRSRCPLSSHQLRPLSQTSSPDIEPCYEVSTSLRTLLSSIIKAVRVIELTASRRGTFRTSTCSWRGVSVVTGPSRPSHATIFKSARESRNSSENVWMPMTTASMS